MPHQIIWSWYTGRGVGCYIWYSVEGTGRAPRPLLAVPNVTAHPSTASVPITVLLYNGPLRCGFNVGINGLSWTAAKQQTEVDRERRLTDAEIKNGALKNKEKKSAVKHNGLRSTL